MAADTGFKLTYATMFNPPEEFHTRFEEALARVKANLGKEHGMIIGGQERFSAEKFEDRNPANTEMVLGIFQKGSAQDAHDAIAAAKKSLSRLEPYPLAGTRCAHPQSRRSDRSAYLRNGRGGFSGGREKPH